MTLFFIGQCKELVCNLGRWMQRRPVRTALGTPPCSPLRTFWGANLAYNFLSSVSRQRCCLHSPQEYIYLWFGVPRAHIIGGS